MTKKRSIALKLSGMPYGNLKSLSNVIYDGFVNYAATYVSPPVSLVAQQDANIELENALDEYGGTGHRAGRRELQRLRDACAVVRGNLKQLACYAEAVTPDDVTTWINVGFTPKELRAKADVVGQPYNVLQVQRHNTMPGSVHLVWKQPLGTIRRRMIIYKIMRSADTNFTNAVEVGTTTKRSFVDVPPLQGEVYYYWIIPINSYGNGVASPMAMAIAQKTIVQHA